MTGREIRIAPGVSRAILAHARGEAPRECCGFLLGTGDDVRYALALINRAAGRSRYRVDPRDHLAVRRVLRMVAPPLEIVGVYHSHPRGPAVPSATDVAEAHYPDWVHVIATLGRRARTHAFRIRHGQVEPLRIVRSGA